MVWNDQLKREIPAGWLVVSITDHADVYQPKTISSRLFDDSHPFPVYGGGGYIGRFNQFNHQESEVIISCRGDCGRVYLTMPESWVTGNAMVVHPRGDCLPKEYLYLLLKNSNLEHYVTGSVQKQLTRQNFELLPILVPSRDVLERFTSFTKITISRQLEIVRENRKLQELRDWLLPMLMNGQATVANSDKLSFCVDRTTTLPADNAQCKVQFDAMLYLLTESPRINLRRCMRTSSSGLTERRRKVRWCIDSSDQNDDPLAKSHFAVLPREIRSRAHTPTHCSHVSIATSTLS